MYNSNLGQKQETFSTLCSINVLLHVYFCTYAIHCIHVYIKRKEWELTVMGMLRENSADHVMFTIRM